MTFEGEGIARLQRHPVFDRAHRGSCAVVISYFNPCNYQSRTRNLLRTLDALDSTAVPVFAAELRCGAASHRPPVLPVNHARVLQLTSSCVMSRRENLWNLVTRRVPERYRNIICLDADIILANQQVAEAVEDALAVASVLHPFTRAIWLDSLDRPINARRSFGWAIAHQRCDRADRRLYHPGFGFAARREFWDVCGGVYNGVLGDGDWMFVAAVCGRADDLKPLLLGLSRGYWEHYVAWASRVHEWCGGSLGYVEGDALHLWHGNWRDRQYDRRVARLRGFDPHTDIAPNDSTGAFEWTPFAYAAKPELVAAVESYFGTRLEDAESLTA